MRRQTQVHRYLEYELISDQVLRRLRCMHTATPLMPVGAETLIDINKAIAGGQLRDGLGRVVDTTFEGGVVNEEGTVFYPLVNGILQMLRDEVIKLPDRFQDKQS